jgi:DNA-binding response OmpR family regulator
MLLELDESDMRETWNGEPRRITIRERAVLRVLSDGKCHSREEILQKIGDPGHGERGLRNIDTIVKRIRMKTRRDFVDTIYGSGYRLQMPNSIKWITS